MISIRFHHILTFVTWLPIIVFSGLLTFNSAHYFVYDSSYGFLAEKTEELKNPAWYASFYIHVATATICLLVPFFQFLIRVKAKTHKAHRFLGRAYVLSTLFFVCPTGMYLALYAKGGTSAQLGFMAQGIFLAIFTWLGYKMIREGNLTGHKEWMIRSYAIAIAALTFRLYHVLFIYLGIPYEEIYAASQWISVMGNLFIAELIISYLRKRAKTALNS